MYYRTSVDCLFQKTANVVIEQYIVVFINRSGKTLEILFTSCLLLKAVSIRIHVFLLNFILMSMNTNTLRKRTIKNFFKKRKKEISLTFIKRIVQVR